MLELYRVEQPATKRLPHMASPYPARRRKPPFWRRLIGAPAAFVCWLSDHVAGSPSSSREPMGAAPPPLPSPRSELERILALLPPDHRRVLHLRFHEGYTIKETARAMQLSEANARVLQYQAVQGTAALVRSKEVAQS
jgi:DNA-directed RNA polymerase specialized sigma24 family protein